MTTLLHISDPHFGTEQPPVVDALLQLVREQPPDQVILSGDVTQRARRAQFSAARRFIDDVGAPRTLVIPGNHDIPLFNVVARLFAPYAGFIEAFGAELEPVAESPQCLVIALNTTRARRHKHGEVSAQQVERVADRLKAALQGQLRIVVVHQPVAVIREEDEVNLLRGHGDAIARWSSAGADLVLGGHIHLPYVLALHERVKGLARRTWAVQAGTAVSRRVRQGAPNSVNLIRWGDGLPPARCVVERWDYAAQAGGFAKVHETALATGWVDR
ncbi:metallophosphoesterase family protein [Piscinibacter sp. XHJ-5]|uniref:metallophosphoesterase family protein n=1 Tax=Piscinibacter sp. XHJ-5 TaxID=3037797 RepID=UPI00245324A8|nr:metallophosphoesterase family protein [Piscinibacter sp. XHJ-5]